MVCRGGKERACEGDGLGLWEEDRKRMLWLWWRAYVHKEEEREEKGVRLAVEISWWVEREEEEDGRRSGLVAGREEKKREEIRERVREKLRERRSERCRLR